MQSESTPLLSTWAVYFNTIDFPDLYCARRFHGDTPTAEHITGTDIDCVRNWIKQQALGFAQGEPVCLARSPHDEPTIVEVWL